MYGSARLSLETDDMLYAGGSLPPLLAVKVLINLVEKESGAFVHGLRMRKTGVGERQKVVPWLCR